MVLFPFRKIGRYSRTNKPWKHLLVDPKKSPWTPQRGPYLPPAPPSLMGFPQFHPNWMESLMYRRLAPLYSRSVQCTKAPPDNDQCGAGAECHRHPALLMPSALRGRYCHQFESANSRKPCQLQIESVPSVTENQWNHRKYVASQALHKISSFWLVLI